jgi:hypothetical protein
MKKSKGIDPENNLAEKNKTNVFEVVKNDFKVEFNKEAIVYINKQVDTAIENGIILNDDKDIATNALIATGIEWAKTNNIHVIEPAHIERNWQTIKMGVGNCPPHRCLFTTVISRKSDFEIDVPSFRDLHKKLK